MSKELLDALDVLEKEKGVKREIVIDALEAALSSAYKRNYGQAQNVAVDFDEKKGNVHVYAVKTVVDEVADPQLEVSLKDALDINKAYELGDTIKFEVTPGNFGRIAAQTAKQVILQRVREAEREKIYNEYIQYEHEIVTGEIERQDYRFIYVNLGDVEAVMSRRDQIPGEQYNSHDKIKVYIYKVDNATRGPQVFVSRAHPDLLKRLFEQEVPEIFDGTVEIKAVSREAGDRAKVAVWSNDPNIDPVGTCVGPRGQRVQGIVNELHGENMDIVQWSEDPAEFIANALNPADVLEVRFDPENDRACTVVVPEDELSLAIGKRGQNVRLAAQLTGYKIDIKSEEEMAELDAQAALAPEELLDEEAEVSVQDEAPVEGEPAADTTDADEQED